MKRDRRAESVDMDASRRRSVSLDYVVVENCAPNETLGLNGFGLTFDAGAVRGGDRTWRIDGARFWTKGRMRSWWRCTMDTVETR